MRLPDGRRPHAEFGPNDHLEDAPHFIKSLCENLCCFSANHQAEIRRLAILVMGLIIAFLICWTPVELIALIHFTGKAGMLCENACRTVKNVRNCFLKQETRFNSQQGFNEGTAAVTVHGNKQCNSDRVRSTLIDTSLSMCGIV